MLVLSLLLVEFSYLSNVYPHYNDSLIVSISNWNGLVVLNEARFRDSQWKVKVFPARDNITNLAFESCALVGNSGSLLSFTHGAAIDRHSLVVRMNAAPTKGFEASVGTKIHWRFVNDPVWLRLSDSLQRHETGLVFTTCFVGKNLDIYRPALTPQRNESFDYCIHPHFHAWVQRTFVHSTAMKPSTGLLATIFLSQLCRKLDLYGFAFDQTSSDDRYHYYDTRKQRLKAHDFKRERELITRLQSMHLLTLN
jgi:hypothetical protein